MKDTFKYFLILLTACSFSLFSCASSDTSVDTTLDTSIEEEIKEDKSGSQAPLDPDTDMTAEENKDKTISANNEIGREMNLVALIQQNPNLSTLLELIRAANMVTVLESPAPYTVFTPTNEAFSALPAGTIDNLKLPENNMELRRLIQSHVLPNRISASEMKDNMPMKTATGKNVIVKKSGQNLTVGDATVLIADVNASNGIIHVINKVLVPPQH